MGDPVGPGVFQVKKREVGLEFSVGCVSRNLVEMQMSASVDTAWKNNDILGLRGRVRSQGWWMDDTHKPDTSKALTLCCLHPTTLSPHPPHQVQQLEKTDILK